DGLPESFHPPESADGRARRRRRSPPHRPCPRRPEMLLPPLSDPPASASPGLTQLIQAFRLSRPSALKRLFEILGDVLRIFETNRQADPAVVDAGGGALLFAQRTVSRSRRMRNQRFGVAKIVGDVDQLKPVEQGEGRLFAALDRKSHQGAAAFGHL